MQQRLNKNVILMESKNGTTMMVKSFLCAQWACVCLCIRVEVIVLSSLEMPNGLRVLLTHSNLVSKDKIKFFHYLSASIVFLFLIISSSKSREDSFLSFTYFIFPVFSTSSFEQPVIYMLYL